MTKIDCPTCEGVGLIYDRRVDNRDEEEEIEIEEELEYVKKDWKKYSFLTTSRYACKIEYDENAKELIAYLRKLTVYMGENMTVIYLSNMLLMYDFI